VKGQTNNQSGKKKQPSPLGNRALIACTESGGNPRVTWKGKSAGRVRKNVHSPKCIKPLPVSVSMNKSDSRISS
jgi:hypothetical protein